MLLILGIIISAGFMTWLLAPLGDPEIGAGRKDFREGGRLANIRHYGSNGPPPSPTKPPPPPNPPKAN
jgi:hypothetical protein